MANNDLFGTSFNNLRGVTRAGRGEISLSSSEDYDGTAYSILSEQVQLNYSQELQPRMFAGGDVFAVVQMAQGVLQLGAAVGPGVQDLIGARGSLEDLLSDPYDTADTEYLELNLEDPDLQGHEGYISTGGMKYRLYNWFVQDFNLTSNPNEPPVMTQVSIYSLNIEYVSS